MKSLAELAAIREKMQNKVIIREGESATRVVVGMATCGIAAGARPVLNAFVEGVANNGLTDKVTVTQTGCIGICQYEPVVEVYEEGKEKVTYVKLDSDKAAEIVIEVEGETVEYDVSVYSYLAIALEKGDDSLKDVAKAIYDLNEAIKVKVNA